MGHAELPRLIQHRHECGVGRNESLRRQLEIPSRQPLEKVGEAARIGGIWLRDDELKNGLGTDDVEEQREHLEVQPLVTKRELQIANEAVLDPVVRVKLVENLAAQSRVLREPPFMVELMVEIDLGGKALSRCRSIRRA